MIIGLIGCGKMGSALTLGAIEAGVFPAEDVRAFDTYPAAIQSLGYGITGATSLAEIISQSDVLLLCVKPYDVAGVLKSVREQGRAPQDLLILSIAAGVTLQSMEDAVAGTARVIRVMPNTPALIGKGAAAFSTGSLATGSDEKFAEKLLSAVGTVCKGKEPLLDAVTGTSGSGPAYVYTFIEALADGALLEGIPREQALQLAAQTVLGAAAMVTESGTHPALLRDQVTSPGGTTIAGLAALEEGAFRSDVIKAVKAATRRARELGA